MLSSQKKLGPLCGPPTPQAFEEMLQQLGAAYQQLHAENEVVERELATLRAEENDGKACSVLVNEPVSDAALHFSRKTSTLSRRDEYNDVGVPVGHEGQIGPCDQQLDDDHDVHNWLPSSRCVVSVNDQQRQNHVDQYYRLAARSDGRLTALDLVAACMRFNPCLDRPGLFHALVKFNTFCTFGPEQMDQGCSPTQLDGQDFDLIASNVQVSFFVFERLVSTDDFNHQMLQDDASVLVELRRSLALESSVHMETQDASLNIIIDAVGVCAACLGAGVAGHYLNGYHGEADSKSPLSWVWFAVELCITFFFVLEVVLKIIKYGRLHYFCGARSYWNAFDTVLAVASVLDMSVIIIHLAGYNLFRDQPANFTRFLRLAQLVRPIRMLRHKLFAELGAMVEALFTGLRVLVWAIMLLLLVIYMLSLISVLVVGIDDAFDDALDSSAYLQRSRMPFMWNMFTIFRCFTDGCTAADGTPLHVRAAVRWGRAFMFLYVFIYLFVTIGIFNLIMAIFIDYVMDSSNKRRQREREGNAGDMESRLKHLIGDLSRLSQPRTPRPKSVVLGLFPQSVALCCQRRFPALKARVRRGIPSLDPNLGITRQVFNTWLDDKQMLQLLDDMDVGTGNRTGLFDVLDVDQSGTLEVQEIVSGLMNLRGPAEKCDVIATLMSVRHILPVIEDIHRTLSVASRDDCKAATAEGLAPFSV